MTKWEGVVTKIQDKDWHGTILWSFQIEGEDRWFRTGTKALPATVGQIISFEERNTKVAIESVRQLAEVSGAQQSIAPIESDSAVPTDVRSSATPAGEAVGKRIQWQAARADACNIVAAALALEATNVESKGVLPWAANVAKAKKLDLLIGYINELTKQFVQEESEL
jgi:hypothetical protein